MNISLDKARPFVTSAELRRAQDDSRAAFERVNKEAQNSVHGLGWKRIAENPDFELLEEIEETARNVREDADVFVVCGIGGSYLGSRAVIDVLRPYFRRGQAPEVIYAGHQLSGAYLEELIEYLERVNSDGSRKSVYLNVISKSGSTLETAAAFRVLKKWIHEQFDNPSDRIICTTSPEGGILNDILTQHGYRKFVIPEDVGGRFSVLTPVGLLPVAITGYDIRALMKGAQDECEKNASDPALLLEYAALRRLLYEKKDRQLDLLTTFEPKLYGLTRWLQQLYGESEGKEGKGVFPATATYSTDLHSLGQMVQDGQRNLMETFITVNQPLSAMKVSADDNSAELSYLDHKTFHQINASAHRGTVKAHYEGQVPVFDIELDTLDEASIGHFIYFYELLTAVYGYTLDVNPFNQPGVEQYKNNIYQLLGKEQVAGTNAK